MSPTTVRAARLPSALRAVVAVVLCASTMALVATAASATPVSDAGCTANTLPANDDGYTDAIPLDFDANFFGTTYTSVYINNNGNVTFDGPNPAFSGLELSTVGRPIIAAMFYDIDTRSFPLSDEVTYGAITYEGRAALCVNWLNVGYYPTSTDRLNSAQLLLVDRSDVEPGAFDIVLNYGSITFDGGGSGSTSEPIIVGYSNGSDSTYTLPGSGTGTFIDGGANALVGRTVIISVVGGTPVEPQTITFDTAATAAYGEADRTLTATATSGLAVTYAASGSCTVAGDVLSFGALGTCKVIASQAGDAGHAPADDVERTIEVVKATAAITVTDLAATYDGDPKPVTVVVDPTDPSTTTSVTYDGAVSAPSDAGTYSVVVSVDSDTHAGTVTETLTIEQATQALTVTPVTDPQVGASPVTIAASSDSGLPVTITATGACTLSDDELSFDAAGTCTLTLTQAGDANHAAAQRDVTIDVAKGSASLDVTDLSQTYDTTPRPVGVTTIPSGLAGISVTYDGSPDAPTAAGTYAVVVTLTNDDWAAPTVDATLVVGPTSQTITVTAPTTATYLDGPVTYTATASSGLAVAATTTGPCTLTGDQLSIDGAGTCTITADQAGDGNHDAAPSDIHVITIAKAAQTVTIDDLPVMRYGDSTTVSWTSTSTLPVTLTTDGPCAVDGTTLTATGAGICTVTAHQAGDDDHEPATPVSTTTDIGQADQTITVDVPTSLVWDGPPAAITATSTSGLEVTWSATGSCRIIDGVISLVDVGECTITATQAGDADHTPAEPVTATLTVTPALATLTLVDLIQYESTVTGARVLTDPQGANVPFVLTYFETSGGPGTTTVPTEPGTYTVVASVDDRHWDVDEVTATFEIVAAPQLPTGAAEPAALADLTAPAGDVHALLAATGTSPLSLVLVGVLLAAVGAFVRRTGKHRQT